MSLSNMVRQTQVTVMVAVALVAGCATRRGVDWDSRVGTYTVPQAMSELGQPYRTWDLEDGSRVLEWMTSRTVPEPAGYTGRLNNPIRRPVTEFGGGGMVTTYRHLTLTFGQDGRLLYWNRETK